MNALYPTAIAVVQFLAALVVSAYVAAAAITLVARRGDINSARLVVADGVINGLTLMVAATLLKTLQAFTWNQMLLLAVILGIRTLLRALFTWERQQIIGSRAA